MYVAANGVSGFSCFPSAPKWIQGRLPGRPGNGGHRVTAVWHEEENKCSILYNVIQRTDLDAKQEMVYDSPNSVDTLGVLTVSVKHCLGSLARIMSFQGVFDV